MSVFGHVDHLRTLAQLDPNPAPEPALQLLGGIWVASCSTCGFQLVTARAQRRVERKAARRSCPICVEVA